MPRQSKPPVERINALSTWDSRDQRHLLWQGLLHRGRPAIKVKGLLTHPVRILLQIQDPLVQVRKEPVCPHDRCINPACYRVIHGTSFKYGTRGEWTRPDERFSQFDLDEIEDAVSTFNETGELPEFLSDHCLPEIKRRCNLS